MRRYDVIVCGGGLAGLTVARQLKRQSPNLTCAVLERTDAAVPDAAYKVGEASVEGAAHYFTEQLGLTGYFNKHHLHKLGLRMFFGDPHGPFDERPELGARRFPRVPSFQIDRGIFERDLRRFNRELGVDVFEDTRVVDVDLSATDDHLVHYEQSDGTSHAMRARFVVDATGRRRLLQRKLGLGKESPHDISAVWWRFKGEYDVEKMAAARSPLWSPKTQERKWFSTNHLMGHGYWVWMIPLASGNTSVGIVVDSNIHKFEDLDTDAKARAWLLQHEPTLAKFIHDAEPLDFLKMKRCSYGSTQIFSDQRWACIGEAGIFLDPFYSPGGDFIAHTNWITTRMVELDRRGELTAQNVAAFNRHMLQDMWNNFLPVYLGNYSIFGSAAVMFTKVMWDTSFYWALPSQMLFRQFIGIPEAHDEFHKLATEFTTLQCSMQQCFRDWAPNARSPREYMFVEYSKVPICAELHLDLLKDKSPERCFREMRHNIARLREWSQDLQREVYGHSPSLEPSDAIRSAGEAARD